MSDAIERPKRRIWLRVLFAASLGLNLLVVGLATGAVLRHGGMRDATEGRRPPPSLGAVMYRALPRDERHALRDAAVGRSGDDRANSGGADSVERMAALLRAPELDAAAVTALLAEETARREDWAERAEGKLMATVAGMSEAARLQYADRMEEVAQKRGKHGKWRDTLKK